MTIALFGCKEPAPTLIPSPGATIGRDNCSRGATVRIKTDLEISTRTTDGPSHTVPGACRIIFRHANGKISNVVSVQGANAGNDGAAYADLARGSQPVFDGTTSSTIFPVNASNPSWINFSAAGTGIARKLDGSIYEAEIYLFSEFKTKKDAEDPLSTPSYSWREYFVRDDEGKLVFTGSDDGDRKSDNTALSGVLVDMNFTPHVRLTATRMRGTLGP